MSGSFLQGQRQNLSHLVQVLDVVVDRESLGQRAVLWVVPAAQNTGVIAPLNIAGQRIPHDQDLLWGDGADMVKYRPEKIWAGLFGPYLLRDEHPVQQPDRRG